MGEEFYCILKLISGEEILSLIMIDKNDGDPVIVLQNPVTIKILNSNNTILFKIKPWMELSSDDFFIIKPDKIITMTETKDKNLIEIYKNYILELDSIELYNTGGITKPSSKMGYIGSVELARKNLERIYNNIKES